MAPRTFTQLSASLHFRAFDHPSCCITSGAASRHSALTYSTSLSGAMPAGSRPSPSHLTICLSLGYPADDTEHLRFEGALPSRPTEPMRSVLCSASRTLQGPQATPRIPHSHSHHAHTHTCPRCCCLPPFVDRTHACPGTPHTCLSDYTTQMVRTDGGSSSTLTYQCYTRTCMRTRTVVVPAHTFHHPPPPYRSPRNVVFITVEEDSDVAFFN